MLVAAVLLNLAWIITVLYHPPSDTNSPQSESSWVTEATPRSCTWSKRQQTITANARTATAKTITAMWTTRTAIRRRRFIALAYREKKVRSVGSVCARKEREREREREREGEREREREREREISRRPLPFSGSTALHACSVALISHALTFCDGGATCTVNPLIEAGVSNRSRPPIAAGSTAYVKTIEAGLQIQAGCMTLVVWSHDGMIS